jgi:hypothetical protein
MSSTNENAPDVLSQINSSSLSLDEELEVFLTIFVIGQTKGWELLQPEQVQKLIDNGRLKLSGIDYEIIIISQKKKWENAKNMVDVFMTTIVGAFEKAIIEKMQYCTQEEWDNKKTETKLAVGKLLFFLVFEIKLDEIPQKIYTTWSEGS